MTDYLDLIVEARLRPPEVCDSFADLTKRIAEKFPNAKKGQQAYFSDTGEAYIEFSESALARPDAFDMEVVSKAVIARFSQRLAEYFQATKGQLYWRIPLEEDWVDMPQVIRYDKDGPDKDIFTQLPCYLDHRWKRYGVYCRLLRSDKPVKEFA